MGVYSPPTDKRRREDSDGTKQMTRLIGQKKKHIPTSLTLRSIYLVRPHDVPEEVAYSLTGHMAYGKTYSDISSLTETNLGLRATLLMKRLFSYKASIDLEIQRGGRREPFPHLLFTSPGYNPLVSVN